MRWIFGLAIAALIIGVPIVHYRSSYAHAKRLRAVEAGVLYRSGAMTASGFREALQRHGIRTVINLQDEFADPVLPQGYLNSTPVKETDVCRELGVCYLHLSPDLISRRKVPAERPAAIERFLAVMDDPANYPVLIHCKAGLHRTGVMAAVFRMEYQKWTRDEALREIKDLGFGDYACTSANDYIVQYILTYQRGLRTDPRQTPPAPRPHSDMKRTGVVPVSSRK
jgi:tyrosine-protein phosphatase SIW14